jgi:dihydrofolate reductase
MSNTILIAAVDDNYVIGNKGKLPWRLSDDLKHFRSVTTGHPVLMGRKTFQSLGGQPLPGRQNIVVSSTLTAPVNKGYRVARSLEKALLIAYNFKSDPVYIIGGGALYDEAIRKQAVDEMLITHVHGKYEGDTYFPYFDIEDWEVTEKLVNPVFTIKSYKRV